MDNQLLASKRFIQDTMKGLGLSVSDVTRLDSTALDNKSNDDLNPSPPKSTLPSNIDLIPIPLSRSLDQMKSCQCLLNPK